MRRRQFLKASSLATIATFFSAVPLFGELAACSSASPTASKLTFDEALRNRTDVSNMEPSQLDVDNTDFESVFIEDAPADTSFTSSIIAASTQA